MYVYVGKKLNKRNFRARNCRNCMYTSTSSVTTLYKTKVDGSLPTMFCVSVIARKKVNIGIFSLQAHIDLFFWAVLAASSSTVQIVSGI